MELRFNLGLQLDVGPAEEAKATLAALHDDFQILLHSVEGEMEYPLATPPNKECKPQKTLLVEDDCEERAMMGSGDLGRGQGTWRGGQGSDRPGAQGGL